MPISSPQHSPDLSSGSPLLIHGESTKPLGVRIRQDFYGDDGIRIFDATRYFSYNVHATLDSNLRHIMAPFPGASDWQNVFGHKFDSSDVERVSLDDRLIWIPQECRPRKERYVDILEKGIVKLELLDYPEIVEFLDQNREALSRLGLEFDK
jgi:hypothetical protein